MPPESSTANNNWKRFFTGPLIWGLCILVLINLTLLIWQPLSAIDPDSLPAAHTWVWWATRDFENSNPPPSIVLLGSSLIMHSVSRQDADFLNKDFDYVHHHISKYMEHQLTAAGLPNLNCFNFALPGGMVSDDYIVARALFTHQRSPKFVILGLSLRDFIDNGVHCAGATPAFRYLKRYTTIDDIVNISMPQPWQQFDYWMGKYFYLWGKKLDLQVALAEESKKLLGPFISKVCQPSTLNNDDLSRNLPSNLRAEVEEGMFIVKSHQPYSFEDNSSEYRKRYRSSNEKLFAIQKIFLEKTLRLCQQRGIQVVIVNMPLTQQNLSLMPKGSYDKYLSTLQEESKLHNCDFLDLNSGSKFQLSNFYDTSHMNSSGGKKLIDTLVAAISSDRKLLSAYRLTSSAKQSLATQDRNL